MDDVRLAVDEGYKFLEVYELYEYKVTRYDLETCEGGLLADYIVTFMKSKSNASGYLDWFRSPADEERYIESLRKS